MSCQEPAPYILIIQDHSIFVGGHVGSQAISFWGPINARKRHQGGGGGEAGGDTYKSPLEIKKLPSTRGICRCGFVGVAHLHF